MVNEFNTNGIRCGNTEAHGKAFRAYHATVAEVRDCFAYSAYERECEEAAEKYADDEGSGSYARYLERRAEQGSWFGFGD